MTIRADDEAIVRMELRGDLSLEPTIVEVPLKQLATQQLRQQLGESGGNLLVHRSPGDKLRVVLARDHLVFQPNEVWNLELQPDLVDELAEGPVQVELRLRRTGEKNILWQAGRQMSSMEEPLEFEIICPDQEDAYRLTITARRLEGFATRFLPGQQAKVLASREVEFVVVDPQAKLPELADQWEPVLSIDPANPRWWQRLPSWAQVSRLPRAMPGSIGNVQPVVRPGPAGDLVELPPAPPAGDPYWQSYTLPVRETGQPHVVEIQYPLELEQHLAISVIEPDASGQVTASQRDAGFYTKGTQAAGEGEIGIHRFVFWPRTRAPQLLIVNRHSEKPAQYGRIDLLRHDAQATAAETTTETEKTEPTRLVACFLSKPMFAEYLGAAKSLDASSGLSVQTWSTFLDGANRLAQHVRSNGYNGVMLSVAADGSSLYPSELLNPSPRYDTGLLAASGQDPMRKDVLELLLRVFDREGLRIVPMVQMTTPLPRLELARRNSEAQTDGIAWVGAEGRTWLQQYSAVEGRAPYYNVLNDRVQAELGNLVSELSDRYRGHDSFAGVGLQLSGEGYGLLPGLAWGMDDATIADFSRETGTQVPSQDAQRFQRRAAQLLGPDRAAWQAWRSQKLTQMYAKMASALVAERNDLQLVLATEEVFSGSTLQQQVRRAISKPTNLSQVLLEHGLDFTRLAQTPGIVAMAPLQLGASNQFQQRARDLRINAATDQGELLPLAGRSALLFHHSAEKIRLASFDALSPFGADRTRLTLTCQPSPVGATQRRYLAAALARSDALTIVEGGEFFSFGSHPQLRDLRKIVQQLPGPEAEVRTQTVQPLVMRVYRSKNATTVSLINESPWPISVKLPLRSHDLSAWKKLGDENEESSGSLAAGEQEWLVELPPASLQAWAFDSTQLRLGQPQVSLDTSAREDLQQRIEAIESRTGNLNIRRPYPLLVNPGFELPEEGSQIAGWQPLIGSQGRAKVVSTDAHSGTRALRFRSEGLAGVAIQSDLFPMPETGQLMLSGQIRGLKVSPKTRLRIVFEDPNKSYRQVAILGGEQPIDSEWSRFEFPVDDIPFRAEGQMRVQLHLTGDAEVLLDDLELVDLQFDKLHRGALVKGVYAAKTALDAGQVIDCLRLVEEYWSQYLIEYVPPVEAGTLREAKQPAKRSSKPETLKAQEERPSISGRLRGWVPKLWR
ncbi:MAG: family 10 glycosylhydrolase [Planctomycetes bacterium]|nr:family 10 glycosylhydrolase [Planctomycetota bacterium]